MPKVPIKRVYKVESGPLVDWLNVRVKKYNSIEELADIVELKPNWMTKLINGEFKTVELKRVDQIICKDDTIHIRELYPEIYEELV